MYNSENIDYLGDGWGYYQNPFDNPGFLISYWEHNSIEDLKERYSLS